MSPDIKAEATAALSRLSVTGPVVASGGKCALAPSGSARGPTDADRREAAVEAHAEMVGRARRHDGCIDLAISAADPLDPRRINIFELWRDQEALDAWRTIADPPDVPRTETHVRLYRSEKAENPF